MSAPALLYLSSDDVLAAMPPIEERIALAERTMTALANGAELPPKVGVHPRPEGSFAHAMPAHARGSAEDGGQDLLGMKWVAGFGTNNAAGLPAIHALVVVNDPLTGLPTAVLDGGPITAHRTAAVSGVAIRRYAPRVKNRPTRAAIIGAGVQGHSHVPVLGHLLPGVEVTIFDRHHDRAARLAEAAAATAGVAAATVGSSAREAIGHADVVVTAASFGPVRQTMTTDWFSDDVLIVPVDYATSCAAEVAREAALFLVDDVGQFRTNRDAGLFEDYPDPAGSLGEAILAGEDPPKAGRVVVTHLGVGLADVVFADAIVRAATRRGSGTALRR